MVYVDELLREQKMEIINTDNSDSDGGHPPQEPASSIPINSLPQYVSNPDFVSKD